MFSLPRSRFAISGALVAFVAAFLAIPAAQASAEIIVNLEGTGTGTVTSNPAGIECSNEAIRESQVSSALPSGSVHFPACMALEMISSLQQESRPPIAGVLA